MANVKRLIRELSVYALGKPGAAHSGTDYSVDPLERPEIDLPGLWTTFFEVDEQGDERIARLPVRQRVLEALREEYPVIRLSEYSGIDGHVYMEVPLSADLPVAFLEGLVDESYELVREKLDSKERLELGLAGLLYDEQVILGRLIDAYDLSARRREICGIARRAVLLRTTKCSLSKIPRGASRVGGRPDLSAKADWPSYRDGKPLAFLAQLNLAEIAKVGTPIRGLPARGLLSVFSAWGWVDPDGVDPQTPDSRSGDGPQQTGWTVAVHTPPRSRLERRKTPRGTNSFRAARVEPVPIPSLPKHRDEPALATRNWTEVEYEAFDSLQSAFLSIQLRHLLKRGDDSHHLLGGYALFQQQFDVEALELGLSMFLQLGSDGNSGMMWGDGGELTFYADPRALAKGRFERIWGTCQGG